MPPSVVTPWREEEPQYNAFAAAPEYYGKGHRKSTARLRSYSIQFDQATGPPAIRRRRSSHDETSRRRSFRVHNIDELIHRLLEVEDTDKNHQITIEDQGPKSVAVGTSSSGGYRRVDINGHYQISNLLQELTHAKAQGLLSVTIDEERLLEDPTNRLERLIKFEFWSNLTRRMDGSNILVVGKDPKDWTDNPRPRVYVPAKETEQIEYYRKVASDHPEWNLDVRILPVKCDDPAYVASLNDAPGILALAMNKTVGDDGKETLSGVPFVVPGGRFNELYNWDSYFTSRGLLTTGLPEHVALVRGMLENFIFCIKHYGKILNANRSYYLCRSQPPFLTDMAMNYYRASKRLIGKEAARAFLKECIIAAIKEYFSVWMAKPRLDPATGLSRYRPSGLGVPPETEAGHFHHILFPYAKGRNIEISEFIQGYNEGIYSEPSLDDYLLHDRAVRESGHDTTYRLEGMCANLATVDLNSCLFRFEKDIATALRSLLGGELDIPEDWRCEGMANADGTFIQTPSAWEERAKKRGSTMVNLMWNPDTALFHDYDTVIGEQSPYESVTTFWALWAGACPDALVLPMVSSALFKFEEWGGLASGTETSRGQIRIDRPNRQWDYPFGWAPHQILAWDALLQAGFKSEAIRVIYKWCHMVVKAFIDFNGVVVEKYNVTRKSDPHKVDAEYGNQGADFKGVASEGFGWVNSSFLIGLGHLPEYLRRRLRMADWDHVHRSSAGPESAPPVFDSAIDDD